jgi:hypothetical protein
MVCRVESWILHGVPRVEKGCGTLLYHIRNDYELSYLRSFLSLTIHIYDLRFAERWL